MKLALSLADGKGYCSLCDWHLLSEKGDALERAIREHLGREHGRILVSRQDHPRKRKTYHGVDWPRDPDVPEGLIQ